MSELISTMIPSDFANSEVTMLINRNLEHTYCQPAIFNVDGTKHYFPVLIDTAQVPDGILAVIGYVLDGKHIFEYHPVMDAFVEWQRIREPEYNTFVFLQDAAA